MSQTKPPPWRHSTAGQLFWQLFSAGLPRGGVKSGRISCRFFLPLKLAKTGERAGWIAVWSSSLTGWKKPAQFKTRIVSDVLLLSYLDKIGLSLTVEAGQALAFLYSEARLYSIRDPDWRVFLSRLPHVLQATSPCGYRKSATATHLEQWVLCSFPLKITAPLSLHFQHLNED